MRKTSERIFFLKDSRKVQKILSFILKLKVCGSSLNLFSPLSVYSDEPESNRNLKPNML